MATHKEIVPDDAQGIAGDGRVTAQSASGESPPARHSHTIAAWNASSKFGPPKKSRLLRGSEV